jgi:hypothetical protein
VGTKLSDIDRTDKIVRAIHSHIQTSHSTSSNQPFNIQANHQGKQNHADHGHIQGDISMSHKRDRFIAQLRQLAKDKGLTFRQEEWRGKGGHAMI